MGVLPSLDRPRPGTACERCGRETPVLDFCAACFEESMQERERVVAGQLAEARKRARTWQLSRAVQS